MTLVVLIQVLKAVAVVQDQLDLLLEIEVGNIMLVGRCILAL